MNGAAPLPTGALRIFFVWVSCNRATHEHGDRRITSFRGTPLIVSHVGATPPNLDQFTVDNLPDDHANLLERVERHVAIVFLIMRVVAGALETEHMVGAGFLLVVDEATFGNPWWLVSSCRHRESCNGEE